MRVVIVGGSHAGISCAEALRQNGFDGEVVIVDRLSGLPIERPPLSKAFLAADAADEARFVFRTADWFDLHDVELRAGCDVTGINAGDRQLLLDDGTSFDYDRLVLALSLIHI